MAHGVAEQSTESKIMTEANVAERNKAYGSVGKMAWQSNTQQSKGRAG